jgi:sec-independent protein translocase protein TatA
MIGSIGPLEIGIVLVIALLVFGPKKLPELGRSVGGGMREFKESITNHHERIDAAAEAEAKDKPKS